LTSRVKKGRNNTKRNGGKNILRTKNKRRLIGLVKSREEIVIEGNIKRTGRHGRKYNLLLDMLKEARRYWELK